MSAETKVCERPILFNGEMVRAILDGRKTQTRRPVKVSHGGEKRAPRDPYYYEHGGELWTEDEYGEHHLAQDYLFSSLGRAGDLLWIRETWRQFNSHEECACYDDCLCSRYHGRFLYHASSPCDEVKWRPSIHMPREASRITLRVKRVWIERLYKIDWKGVYAEGVKLDLNLAVDSVENFEAFEALWDSIYGGTEYKSENNPWVWACEFEVLGVKS